MAERGIRGCTRRSRHLITPVALHTPPLQLCPARSHAMDTGLLHLTCYLPWGRAPPPAPGLINKQLNNCRIAMLSHVKQLSMQYTPTHYNTASPRPVPIRTYGRAFSMPTIQAASGRNLLPCIQSTYPSFANCNSMHLSEVSQNRLKLAEWRSYL
jgi:hypothetical protein